MNDCPICKKENAQGIHTHLIKTAIQTTSRIKTGFKQYQVTTRTFAPQDHVYKICDSCETNYSKILPYAIWAVAIILAILAFIFIKHEDPMLVLFCVSPMPIALAFYLNRDYLGLNAMLKRKAIKERKAGGVETIVAFTSKEYERFVSKNKKKI